MNNTENKNTVICHSFPAWDTPYIKSTLELMKRLASFNRVILIDYHYTWKDVFTNKHAPKKRILGVKNRWRKIQTDFGTLEIYNSPPVLPTNWINSNGLLKLANALNGFILRIGIRKILRQTGKQNTILINALNPVFGLITSKAWKVKKSFYYCYDEISGTDWASKHGPSHEAKFAQKVDGIICTSEHLQSEKSKLNSNCHLVPNGVNLDIFQPVDIEKNKSKSIGYVGAIDKRIDFKLLIKLAEELPNYHIDLYGPIKTELTPLPLNIRFQDNLSQEELPEKISEMSVCLIPFIKSELTKSIYPLKANEYLAMGKPVVSTDFANLSELTQFVSVSENNNDFVELVKKAIKYDSRLKAQKRIDFAKKNSWKERSLQLEEIIKS